MFKRTLSQVLLLLSLIATLGSVAVSHAQTVTPAWAGPAMSGSWYDPARSGEGIIVEYISDGTAIALWFTFPPAGDSAQQAWLITDVGVVDANKIRFNVSHPQGGVFGPGFNPANINRVPWGTLELETTGCNSLVARWVGPAAYGSGERTLTRLTTIDQIDCAGTRTLAAGGGRALAGLKSKSGAWFVPSRSGEGWLIEELPGGAAVVYWFTFTPTGEQAWVGGLGVRNGDRIDVSEVALPRGTSFGSAFNAAAVVRPAWGNLSFSFTDCNTATVTYTSTMPGYGSGTHTASRLTTLAGAPCINGTPQASTNGSWVEEAAIPGPAQSELATTDLDGKLYAMGGFGDPRGFKRFDPVTRAWETLTPMPAGRDHHSAFAFEGGVYFSGGSANGGGDQNTSGFRYDVAARRWDERAEMPFASGSQAALLYGRAYIGATNGVLREYDPRRRALRVILAPAGSRPRDHAQVIAFQGEIWVIGGRTPETSSTVIYDPVSERWRTGPSLQHARAGFAAAVVGDQIVLGGGEILGGSPRVEPTVEAYVAGATQWLMAPSLPIGVHGVGGVGLNGRFYVVSGATGPGTADGSTGRMFSIQLGP